MFKGMSDHSSFGMLVSADNQRSKARQDRLAESTPAPTNLIFWFLLVTMSVTGIALGMCLPRKEQQGPAVRPGPRHCPAGHHAGHHP
ncbi:hypothetical protein T261_1507 [Streptomyces lydicus]|nr:hypothetical protein T261_1507 [Streptomyces lydicus]